MAKQTTKAPAKKTAQSSFVPTNGANQIGLKDDKGMFNAYQLSDNESPISHHYLIKDRQLFDSYEVATHWLVSQIENQKLIVYEGKVIDGLQNSNDLYIFA